MCARLRNYIRWYQKKLVHLHVSCYRTPHNKMQEFIGLDLTFHAEKSAPQECAAQVVVYHNQLVRANRYWLCVQAVRLRKEWQKADKFWTAYPSQVNYFLYCVTILSSHHSFSFEARRRRMCQPEKRKSVVSELKKLHYRRSHFLWGLKVMKRLSKTY